MKIETLTQNIEYIAQGFQAENERAILPIYYDQELTNGAAYTAFRIRRFLNHAGEAAMHALEIADQVTYHIANN